MKPKFLVTYEGTLGLFAVRYWNRGKKIPHEAFPCVPYNTIYGGWLFSNDEIAEAFAGTLNAKIKTTIKKFQQK